MYVFIKNDHFNKKFSFLKCRFSTFLFSNQVKNFDESVLPVNTQWKYIWIFLLSTPSVWPVNVSRPNFTWRLSVLPALRVPGLFCVHCSALNRIVKLSDIFFFPSLLTRAFVLVKKEEKKITLSWFYHPHLMILQLRKLSVWLLGG